MIKFISVASTAMFIANETLTWDYTWFLFAIGLVLHLPVRGEIFGKEIQAVLFHFHVNMGGGGHQHGSHGRSECAQSQRRRQQYNVNLVWEIIPMHIRSPSLGPYSPFVAKDTSSSIVSLL
jgi:hypothetical protein